MSRKLLTRTIIAFALVFIGLISVKFCDLVGIPLGEGLRMLLPYPFYGAAFVLMFLVMTSNVCPYCGETIRNEEGKRCMRQELERCPTCHKPYEKGMEK